MRYLFYVILVMTTLALSADETAIVRYRDFGAKGDGKTNDFEALLKAHQHANENGLPVRAEDDATYYIGETTERIPIMTDTTWGKAHFIIDDRLDFSNYGSPIFQVRSQLQPFPVEGLQPLKRGQTSIGIQLPRRAVLIVSDDQTRRFIRYGSNANNGSVQVDSILVDQQGNIDSATPVNWDFNSISQIRVCPVDETPLRITGGTFKTFTNARAGRHKYFGRNISVIRSNTILEGVRHEVVEPKGLDSWPYTGFITISDCAEVTVKNCQVSGRKVYGWLVPKTNQRKTTGTYDISCARALKLNFINVRQINDILDTALWGVMGTNFCKSITLDTCRISRFDAHQGVTNAIIRNCELGHQGINAIGFGTFLIENTVNHCSSFVNFRADYGSTWHGNFIIRNCKFEPVRGWSINVFGGKATPSHDFGYPCTMPETISIDGLAISLDKIKLNRPAAMFTDFVSNNENETAPYPYQVTRQLIVKNVTVSGGDWIFARNEQLFKDIKVKGTCPGYSSKDSKKRAKTK